MLTLIEVPPETLANYQKSKEVAREIVPHLCPDPETRALKHGTNLTSEFQESAVIIVKGIFKCFSNNRFVRFYSAGDMVLTSPRSCDIIGEMGTEAIILTIDEFGKRIHNDPRLSALWSSYLQMDAAVMRGLCAAYAGEDFKPEIDLVEYQSGDPIIREGESPDCLYEMVEGRASVTVKGTEVGTVSRGEVFGEVSFLTASPRTASVTATSRCTVQAINGRDFDKIVKYRPTLVSSMARTIARRLAEVNDRLVRDASLT